MTTPAQVFHWLLLHHLPGVSAAYVRKLLLGDAAHTPDNWLMWPQQRLRACGFSELACNSVREWQLSSSTCEAALKARRDQKWLAANNVQLLHLGHPLYPPLLLEISDPPLCLFVAGDPSCLSRPQLAVVGSRSPSQQGLSDAGHFGAELAAAGFVVTSGLAYGIDAAAHRAALNAGGTTIAVLGCGIDRVYPAEHRELALAIRGNGAVISELPLQAPPRAVHFPSRNRIISGLSLGVLVVEAALQSGSLVTARLALEQNREVFALPGSIHNPVSRGTNTLIRGGATLVQDVGEILQELGGWSNSAPLQKRIAAAQEVPMQQEAVPVPQESELQLSADEAAILAAVGFEPTPLDLITAAAARPLPAVLAVLSELELRGLVENRAGSYQRSGAEPVPTGMLAPPARLQ